MLEVEILRVQDLSPMPKMVIDGKTYVEAVSNTSYFVKIKPRVIENKDNSSPVDIFRVELYIDGVRVASTGYTPKNKLTSSNEYVPTTFRGFITDEMQ